MPFELVLDSDSNQVKTVLLEFHEVGIMGFSEDKEPD